VGQAHRVRLTQGSRAAEARVVELDGHPFFVATLFWFQTRSRPRMPHPLVAGLIAAAQAYSSSQ
jgi:CTP synthase (UTP-ammonia lyase)